MLLLKVGQNKVYANDSDNIKHITPIILLRSEGPNRLNSPTINNCAYNTLKIPVTMESSHHGFIIKSLSIPE